MSSTRLGLVIAAAAVALGCGESTPATPGSGPPLQLSFSGLPPLQNGFHYEGWAIIGGQPFSTGKFNVAADGSLRTTSGAALPGGALDTAVDVARASTIVITVEPAGDNDPAPATTKILAGSVANRMAVLSVAAPEALGTDFGGAAGVFILATPTDGPDTNETSGIWFIDNRSGSPAPGLSLPTLPAGWQYEGWVVFGSTPVTTGKFTRVNSADAAAPFSGPLPGPPFPGEDFLRGAPAGLQFPRDLGGTMAVITIEPSPDDSPMPFMFRPLAGPVPAGTPPMVVRPLSRQGLPAGTAVIG